MFENSARSERKIVLYYAGQSKRTKMSAVLGRMVEKRRKKKGRRAFIYLRSDEARICVVAPRHFFELRCH